MRFKILAAAALFGVTVFSIDASAHEQTRPLAVRQLRDYDPAISEGKDITNALSAAFSAGDSPEIRIPKGTYEFAAKAFTAASSISLVGDPNGSSELRLPQGAVCNAGLFRWINGHHVQIRDITIDLNGASVAPMHCFAFGFTGGSAIDIERVRIINAGRGGWMLISINGASDGQISDARLAALAPQTLQNEAINVSIAAGSVTNWRISNNFMINSGVLLEGRNIYFCGNEISGWAYGAGVSTGEGTAGNMTLCRNVIHDSGKGRDADGVYPFGIESWGRDIHIHHNRVDRVASNGIFVGGQGSVVCANVVSGAGERSDGVKSAGIQVGYVSPTYNGNGSEISNNAVSDDGMGTTVYGYEDNPKTIGVSLWKNDFRGVRGGMLIRGDSRILNSPAPSASACR